MQIVRKWALSIVTKLEKTPGRTLGLSKDSLYGRQFISLMSSVGATASMPVTRNVYDFPNPFMTSEL